MLWGEICSMPLGYKGKYMKIIVVASSKFSSGGTESLHQLVSKINELEGNAYLFFWDNPQKKIEKKFSYYKVFTMDHLEDDAENIVIIPETLTFLRKKIKKARIVIWWLSLDFYIKTRPFAGSLYRCKQNKIMYVAFPILFLYLLMKGSTNFSVYRFKNENQIYQHLYNCEYVASYLKTKGVCEEKLYYLCGPINKDFFKNVKTSPKKDIVIYNPAKGMKYTKRVVDKLMKKNIMCIPLTNMSRDEVIDNMNCAKIYIDFGFFPGPERVPREAVICRCNLVTAWEGSATNAVDIPIPNEFKYGRNNKNIDVITNKIISMIRNYNTDIVKFDIYRDKVLKQNLLFDLTIKKLLKEWKDQNETNS